MADTTVRYEPRNYRRVCDICGMLRNISDMHRQDELWVCTYDAGERVRTELDRGNANQRPFTIKPVPYPKPQNDYYPNLLETDDAAVFNFLSQQVAARCRYEYVQSGHAVDTADGQALPALSWAARYFYDLIQENDPSRALLIPKAKDLLGTIATYVQTRQRGFGISSGGRAADAFYGGFLASGATEYVTRDASTCGLALLYAYRVLGTTIYRDGARAAASYLRNVQAIGSNGTNFTSTNPAGTGRLYTGAVASQVSTTFGADPGQIFYSNHLFYPGDLVALEFWNELKTTDGDQSIGATAAVNGFDSIPAKLLSDSIADMRTCWETGITDSTGTLINGLSTTTPKEYFNAYPLAKPGFHISGTGLWEYVDGSSTAGTEVSSQNFCLALEALYAYEGATSQVTALSDWLRSFTSNADFETAANTSIPALYHQTTGTYDPTISPATLLQVRDPSTLASTTINASSLYDWGSFGLLSRIWAARNKGSFMVSRLYPLNTVQRFFDGNPNDGLTSDRIILRGMSGLTLQTGFSVDAAGNALPGDGTGVTSARPPTTGLVMWLKGDAGLISSGGAAIQWKDQSAFGQDVTEDLPGTGPFTGLDTISGIPCVTWALNGGFGPNILRGLFRSQVTDRNANQMGYGVGETQARTIAAVIIPRFSQAVFSITGGIICEMGSTPAFQPLFDLENTVHTGGFYLLSEAWRNPGSGTNDGPDTAGGLSGPYNGVPQVVMWSSTGFPDISVRINGDNVPLTPSTMPGATGPTLNPTFTLGRQSSGGFNFFGCMSEFFIWDHALDDGELTTFNQYITGRYPTLGDPTLMVNDAVRAAQYGRTFREARQ